MAKSGGLLSPKAYKDAVKEINQLLAQYKISARNKLRLMRLIDKVKGYEIAVHGSNHSKRQIRGDL